MPTPTEGRVSLPAAGRALDALVAERIMGWRRYRFGPKSLGRHSEEMAWLDEPGNRHGGRGTMDGVIIEAEPHLEWYADGLRHVPRYSTDIAAAWEVARKLNLMVCPTLFAGLEGYSRWGAGAFKGRTGHDHGGQRYVEPGTWAEGETAPEAICRAALLAVEARKKEEEHGN